MQCKIITDELIDRGFEVYVLTSNLHDTNGQTVGNVYRSLHIRKSASQNQVSRRLQHLQWAFISRRNYRLTRRLIQVIAPDIVYVWNMGYISLGPLAAAQDKGVPLVFELADYWLMQHFQELCLEPEPSKRAYRLFLHGLKDFDPLLFPHMITLSAVLKQQYIDVGFHAEHFSVIPWGIPAKLILESPPDKAQDSSIDLLYAGRLIEDKGVHLAIQTTAYLKDELGTGFDRSIRLKIVGDGEWEYKQSLEKLVESLGLKENVHFVGKVSQEELFEIYKQHDVVLVPSIWVEPFGGITIEAMSQGTCVIASKRGGPAEIITHRYDGILVPPEDPRAMAQAVIDLIKDGDLTDRIRRASILTVRERYSLDRVGDQIEAYLQAALEAHYRPS